jgi:hypothetical protein
MNKCVNCGKDCEGVACNQTCLDEAIEYDNNLRAFGETVAQAQWEAKRTNSRKTEIHE